MNLLGAEKKRRLLEQANKTKTDAENKVDDFEKKSSSKKKEARNKSMCKNWINNNINSRNFSERIVAETLLSFIEGDNPFATIDDKRGKHLDEERALAMFYALIETDNLGEVSYLFNSADKEVIGTISSLGKRLGISSISAEFRKYKGNTPVYKEMMINVKGNLAVMAMSSDAFFKQFESLVHNSLSSDEWLSTHKKGGK